LKRRKSSVDSGEGNFELLGNSVLSLLVGLSISSILFVFSIRVLLISLLSQHGVLSDLLMSFHVQGFDSLHIGGSQSLGPVTELLLELLSSFFFQSLHIIIHMHSEDSFPMSLSIINFFLIGAFRKPGESLGVMGDVKSSIDRSFQSSETSVTSSGGNQSDIEDGLERLFSIGVVVIHGVVFSVHSGLTFVLLVESDLVEETTGTEETGGVGGGVVGESGVDAEFLEFVRRGLGDYLVTLEGGVDDLAGDLVVGHSGHESVLGSVVFVLVLDGESLSGVIVGLAFSSSSELGLETFEVSVVLVQFHESHLRYLFNKYLLILSRGYYIIFQML